MNRSLSLDVIRILATISVVVGHLFYDVVPSFLLPFTKFGGFGVSLFFLLSGYLVTSSVLKNPIWSSFLTIRSFRILPAYYLAFVLYSTLKVLDGSSYTFNETLMYLTLSGYVVQLEPTLMGVEWTLRIEVLFYALAVACLYIHQVVATKLRLQRFHGIVCLLAIQLSMLAVTPYLVGDQRPSTFGQCIIIGILIRTTEKYSFPWKYAILLTSLLIAETTLHIGIDKFDNIPFFALATVVVLVLKSMNIRLSSTLSIIVTVAANCTYSIYLYHNWALRQFLKMSHWSFIAILVFLILTYLTYQLIERPLNNLGRKLAH